MKWSIILATVLVTCAGVVNMPSPADAGFCQNKRTTAIKKFHHHQFSQSEVEAKCFSAVKKKAIATYGPEWKALIDKHVSCELMKVPGKKSYWLCYCSAIACKQAVKPSDDPDLDWKPKKLNRDPGVSRIPHGSFGTRRASPPSFRMPRMGPKIR